MVRPFATNCPVLKTVALAGAEISDASLGALATGCMALTQLDISSCQRITPHGLASLLRRCRVLTELNLSWLTAFATGTALAMLGAADPQVKDFTLLGVNVCDAGAEQIARGFTCLESLKLEYNDKITDEGCRALARLGQRLLYVGLGSCDQLSPAVCHEQDCCLRLDDLRRAS